MDGARETNYHLKQLTQGAPSEAMADLGEGLLALQEQRDGAQVDAAAKLRKAWLAIARWLIKTKGAELNAHHRLFLLSGAVADAVTLKNKAGDKVEIRLLPTETYEQLLEKVGKGRAPYLLSPLRRMRVLAEGELDPLDLDRPGRYREPDTSVKREVDPAELQSQLGSAVEDLKGGSEALSQSLRAFLELVQTAKLQPVLESAQALIVLCQQALKNPGKPNVLAGLDTPRDADNYPGVAACHSLRDQAVSTLEQLADHEQDVIRGLNLVRASAAAMTSSGGEGEVAAEVVAAEPPLVLDPTAAKTVEKDYVSVNGTIVQLLANNPKRTNWSASRILIEEHTEKFDDPLNECYCTPDALLASVAKIDKLVPDCFPHDADGNPLLPPIIIEPGCDVCQWYDDRFVISFVTTDTWRRSGKLNLSPVDQVVLRLYGQFAARGDLYDYRGDRMTGNFVADYAGEVESKAKVKFSGADKKMTIVSATDLKDAAGRDDCVADYMDFVFLVFNGMNLPKRINARRVSVILRYNLIGSKEMTAGLILKYVMNYDHLVARELMVNLAERNDKAVIALIKHAMDNDPLVASKFRKSLDTALEEVMGREWTQDARNKGLIGGGRAVPAAGAGEGGAESEEGEEAGPAVDYFDV